MPTITDWEMGRPIYGPPRVTRGAKIPEFPTYKPRPVTPGYETYEEDITRAIKEFPTMGEYPAVGAFPTYEAGRLGEYPRTQIPTYKATAEEYPGYQAPEVGGIRTQLQETIGERMRGEGTAGAESAIYQRGEERVQERYEERIERVDEQMAARGLTGSGIHGEEIGKAEKERDESLADLSRQITIYGQQAVESAMQKGQQYVESQAAEAGRELAARERGWAGRVGERIRGFESEARAAEVAGRSEEAAYQHATAEKIRGYEAQARAWQATTSVAMKKWQDKANLALQKSQLELQKAQMLMQARQRSNEVYNEEYWKEYQSKYRATMDTYLAQQAAKDRAERKRQAEWERERERIEQQIRRRAELAKEGFFSTLSGEWVPTGGVGTPTEGPVSPREREPVSVGYGWQGGVGEGWPAAMTYSGAGAGTRFSQYTREPEYQYGGGYLGGT